MQRLSRQVMNRGGLVKQWRYEVSVMKGMGGVSEEKKDTKDVELRGSVMQSDSQNNLDMIFFGEMFDQHQHWADFFNQHNITQARNIYMLHPRNFGNSDRHDSFDVEEMADDVVRFMDKRGIKQATLAGHGFGGKMALAVGCYHSTRVTGVCVLDSGPLDHRYYQPHQELVSYIQQLQHLPLDQSLANGHQTIKQVVECPKWRQLLQHNLKENNKGRLEWMFDMQRVASNLIFNKEESLGVWNARRGMFTGRVCFLFPDQSRWVHLNTNTLAMLKTCARCHGYGRDIFAIQADDSPLNHWIYDFTHLSIPFASKFNNFLHNYDGVPLLMQSRQEMREQSTFMSNYTHRNLKFPEQSQQ